MRIIEINKCEIKARHLDTIKARKMIEKSFVFLTSSFAMNGSEFDSNMSASISKLPAFTA